jgi:hypothetical protein
MCNAKYLGASGIRTKKASLLVLSFKLRKFQIAMFYYNKMGKT